MIQVSKKTFFNMVKPLNLIVTGCIQPDGSYRNFWKTEMGQVVGQSDYVPHLPTIFSLHTRELHDVSGGCIECGHPSTKIVAWLDRLEGPYSMCDMDAWHSVKNRGAVELGPYKPEEETSKLYGSKAG